jgi:hypothetical protein
VASAVQVVDSAVAPGDDLVSSLYYTGLALLTTVAVAVAAAAAAAVAVVAVSGSSSSTSSVLRVNDS